MVWCGMVWGLVWFGFEGVEMRWRVVVVLVLFVVEGGCMGGTGENV